MYYHFKTHKEDGQFWAECLELKGCVTQGQNLKELTVNIEEALNLYLDESPDSKHVFPLPMQKALGKNVLRVAVKPNIAFAMLLRQTRLRHKFTQSYLAKQLGMKNIYSYQRLESPRTSNPALSTISRLKQVMPDLRLERVFN